MFLYRPGTPLDGFTDDMKLWAHVFDDGDPNPAELKTWFISSEKNDSGFVGYVPETGTTLANPWEDVTVEQLRQNIGMYFNVPEEAEKATEGGKRNQTLFTELTSLAEELNRYVRSLEGHSNRELEQMVNRIRKLLP